MTQDRNPDVDLERLAAEVEQLLQQANAELLEHQQQRSRQLKIEQVAETLRSRINDLIDQIRPVLHQYQEANFFTATSEQLQQQLQRLLETADLADQIAALQVDTLLWQEQAALLLSQRVEEIRLYREQLQTHVLDQINAAPDFWEATDLAILVRQHADDLAEIGALQPIVELLIDRINELNQENREKPVAYLRGSHRNTLNFIAEQALWNREGSISRSARALPQISPNLSPPQSNRLTGLKGKVVMFGGHDRSALRAGAQRRSDRLIASLKQHLPNVTFVPATQQSGNGQVSKAEAQVATADVVVIMTTYIAHAVGERAKQACSAQQKTPVLINSNGLTRCLQEIEQALSAKPSLPEECPKVERR